VDQYGYSKTFFSFMFMSNQLSSIAQTFNNSCNSLTEGAINKMSSAYSRLNSSLKIIHQFHHQWRSQNIGYESQETQRAGWI